NASGNWTTSVLTFAVSATAHWVTAKEVGVDPISAPWRFTVTQSSVTPEVRSVTGASGAVSNGGTTRDTQLTVTGSGTPNATISIHDENGFRGEYPINASGNWTTSVLTFAVSTTAHWVTAKEVGVDPISAPWRFTVTQSSVTPVIRSVTGAGGAVSNGGTTRDTQLTVTGSGTPSGRVLIYDGTASKGEFPINTEGNWTSSTLVFAVSATPHSVTAREVASGVSSDPWRFTVTQATPSLTIDTSSLALSGHMIRVDQLPTTPPANTYATRSALGGVPPYSYSVSNSNVVDIVASTGRIVSRHSGSATVTVRDSAGQTASYPVSVSNVYLMGAAIGFTWWTDANENAERWGGHVPSLAEWNLFRSVYGNVPPVSNDQAWSTDVASAFTRWVINPVGGQLAQKHTGLTGPNTAAGWVVIPN
ncbi:hypothetical protein NLO95_28375, partial [Pseudomonas syringae]|nr:hypothetical protein [Pseudomonas syringae]